MAEINWGLGLSPNVMGNAFNAFTQGQDLRRADDESNALAGYVMDPNDQNRNAVTKLNPEMGYRLGQQEETRKQQQAQAAQQKLLTVAKLFDGVNDQATYQQRMGMAQRMGIDVSDAPPQFDPAWVQENGAIFKFFAEKPEALSTFGKIAADEGFQPGTPEFNDRVMQHAKAEAFKIITPQPGAGAVAYNPMTGESRVVVEANPGDQPMGQAAQAGPPIGTVVQGHRFKGGNPKDQNSWEPVGGARSNAGGNFRPVSDGTGVARSVFPNAKITSGYRGPDHPLSKKNPGSFHTKTRSAVDMAPIPGMTFAQAKAKFEAQGYTVHPDSRDEVNNPSAHATGPHWHFVIGER